MKTTLLILAILLSGAAMAQLSAKGNTGKARIRPVEFGYIHASRNELGIVLSWRTDIESNNAYFVVQHSTDGINFSDVAMILPQSKDGNSNLPLVYSYQVKTDGVREGMRGILIFMTIFGGVLLIGGFNKIQKIRLLSFACLFLFSCTKSATTSNNNAPSSKTAFRIKQVDMYSHVSYSEVVVLN